MQPTTDSDPWDDLAPWSSGASTFTFDAVVPGLIQGDFPAGTVDWSRFDDVISMTAEGARVLMRLQSREPWRPDAAMDLTAWTRSRSGR
jgi:hypothetical protein